MAWLIWVMGAIVGAVLVGWGIYRITGVPHEKRFCGLCKQDQPFHPETGCTVCRTLDQCI